MFTEPIFNTFIDDRVVSRKASMISLENDYDPQSIITSGPGALCWCTPLSSHTRLPFTMYTSNNESSASSLECSYFSSVSGSASFNSLDSPNMISRPFFSDDTMYGRLLPATVTKEVEIDLSTRYINGNQSLSSNSLTTSLYNSMPAVPAVDPIYSNTTILSPVLILSLFGQVNQKGNNCTNLPAAPENDTDHEISELRVASASAATSNSSPQSPPRSFCLSKNQDADNVEILVPMPSPFPLSPQQIRGRQREIIKKMSYTKWVKLSPMSEQRIDKIRALIMENGIDIETVKSILALYSNTEGKPDNEVNRFRGEDVYIKITIGSDAFIPNNDNSCDVTTTPDGTIKKKNHRKQKPHYVKRPLNSFMLYRKSLAQAAMAYATSSQLRLNYQNVSQIVGLMWQTESKELKDEFSRIADQEKKLHRALHSDYKFCPQQKKRFVSID